MFKSGDQIIYRVTKCSASPGPRASDVSPEPRGEHYTYEVDKYWAVVESRDDGSLVLETRRGKQHIVSSHDPRLRRPSLWERIVLRGKFPRGGTS